MRAVSPTFPAVATVLILISVALLFSLEFLCRRNARLRDVADRMRPVGEAHAMLPWQPCAQCKLLV